MSRMRIVFSPAPAGNTPITRLSKTPNIPRMAILLFQRHDTQVSGLIRSYSMNKRSRHDFLQPAGPAPSLGGDLRGDGRQLVPGHSLCLEYLEGQTGSDAGPSRG